LNFFILILNCVFFCNQHQILTYTVICFWTWLLFSLIRVKFLGK
jgi:hypothetical protein